MTSSDYGTPITTAADIIRTPPASVRRVVAPTADRQSRVIEMMRPTCLGLLLGVCLLATSACSALSHSEPTALQPSGLRWHLAGTIISTAGGPISTARLRVLDGSNQGVQAATDSAGHYAFNSLQGGSFSVTIEAAGYVSATPLVNLSRDLSVDFALSRTP